MIEKDIENLIAEHPEERRIQVASAPLADSHHKSC
jgi:hypothetical protein